MIDATNDKDESDSDGDSNERPRPRPLKLPPLLPLDPPVIEPPDPGPEALVLVRLPERALSAVPRPAPGHGPSMFAHGFVFEAKFTNAVAVAVFVNVWGSVCGIVCGIVWGLISDVLRTLLLLRPRVVAGVLDVLACTEEPLLQGLVLRVLTLPIESSQSPGGGSESEHHSSIDVSGSRSGHSL